MAKPKKRVKPQYSYSDKGLTKISVPIDAGLDRRLTKLASNRGVSKAALARELLKHATA